MKIFKGLIPAVLLAITANAQDFNIKQYGAVSDTTKLSTIAINKAIDVCSRSGGGRVVVPAGNYKTGTIVLKNNVELYLYRGATLYLSTRHQDIPRQKQPAYRSQKDPGGWYAFIYAEGAHNIGISGDGVIDGRGGWQTPRPEAIPGGDLDGRPRNILFISCKDVSVKDITMLNAGIWNQHYLNCEDVIVDRIKVYNHANRNNDGIDIDGCRRFVLSNSIIDSDDDAIVLKSTGVAGCADVVINNCILSSFTNAIKCGTESTGGFKNIAITNCVVKISKSKVAPIFGRTNIGITGISLEIVDGGVMDGVTVNNIMIEGTEAPIYIRLGNRARLHTVGAPQPGFGTMKNVHISNIIATSAGNYTSSITGVPGSSIENVTLDNIFFTNKGDVKDDYIKDAKSVSEDEKGYPEPTVWKNLPASGLFVRHVKNISLSNIVFDSVTADVRPAVIGVDVDNISISGVKNKRDNKQLQFQFTNVKNVITTSSPDIKKVD